MRSKKATGDLRGLQGDRLRESRERKGLKQRDLAQSVDITEFQISRYETGKSDISGYTLKDIAQQLEVSTDYLLGLVDHPNGYNSAPLDADEKTLLEAYAAGDSETVMELMLARARQLKGEKSSHES